MPVDLRDACFNNEKKYGYQGDDAGKSEDNGQYLKTIAFTDPVFYTSDIHTLIICEAINNSLSYYINYNSDQEEHQSQLNERGKVYSLVCFCKFVGDNAGHGITRRKYTFRDDTRITDHHGNGHCLSQGPA